MATKRYGGPKWLREVQSKVGQWSNENFGDQPPEYPLIGAGEELGELTTSVLKRAQGIDDSEKYADRVGDDAEMDAIGDVMIYLLDTTYRAEDDITVANGMARVIDADVSYDHIDDAVDMVRMIYSEYGELTGKRFYTIPDDEWDPDEYEWRSEHDTLEMVEYDLGRLAVALERLCEIRGYSFQGSVLHAWDEVSDREWDADIDQ